MDEFRARVHHNCICSSNSSGCHVPVSRKQVSSAADHQTSDKGFPSANKNETTSLPQSKFEPVAVPLTWTFVDKISTSAVPANLSTLRFNSLPVSRKLSLGTVTTAVVMWFNGQRPSWHGGAGRVTYVRYNIRDIQTIKPLKRAVLKQDSTATQVLPRCNLSA